MRAYTKVTDSSQPQRAESAQNLQLASSYRFSLQGSIMRSRGASGRYSTNSVGWQLAIAGSPDQRCTLGSWKRDWVQMTDKLPQNGGSDRSRTVRVSRPPTSRDRRLASRRSTSTRTADNAPYQAFRQVPQVCGGSAVWNSAFRELSCRLTMACYIWQGHTLSKPESRACWQLPASASWPTGRARITSQSRSIFEKEFENGRR